MLLLTIVAAAVVAYLCSTPVSYYVDFLWFGALGYASVFWTRLALQGAVFCAFAVVTVTFTVCVPLLAAMLDGENAALAPAGSPEAEKVTDPG